MRVHIAVVAHVDRIDRGTALAQALGASLHLDDGRRGAYGNHAAALAYGLARHASHVLTIEDDALPVPDFLALAYEAIARRPNDPIGFYVGKQRPRPHRVEWTVRKAEERSASWLVCNSLLWGVATVFPAADIPGLLAYGTSSDKQYDERVGDYYCSLERPVYYTWPSLVDHDDGPSVIAPTSRTDEGPVLRPPGRVAHRVGTPAWNDITVEIA